MRKNVFCFLLVVFIALFLTSCSYLGGYPVELRSVVQAVAVDVENDDYKVSMQIFSNVGEAGAAGVSPAESNSFTVSGTGKTLPQAFDSISSELGKNIFLAQLRFVVLGEELIKQKGVKDFLNFMRMKIYQIPNPYILISKNSTAAQIIQQNITGGILPADSVEKSIQYLINDGKIQNSNMLSVFKDEQNKNGVIILPAVSLKETPNNEAKALSQEDETETLENKISENETKTLENKIPENETKTLENKIPESETEIPENKIPESENLLIGGAAVIKNGVLLEYLTESELRGITWLNGTFKRTDLSAKNGDISLEMFSTKSKIYIDLSDEQININVKITSKSKVKWLVEPPLNYEQDVMHEIANAAQNEIYNKVKPVLEKCIYEYKINPFLLSKINLSGNKNMWYDLSQNWEYYVNKINLNISVEVKMIRYSV